MSPINDFWNLDQVKAEATPPPPPVNAGGFASHAELVAAQDAAQKQYGDWKLSPEFRAKLSITPREVISGIGVDAPRHPDRPEGR